MKTSGLDGLDQRTKYRKFNSSIAPQCVWFSDRESDGGFSQSKQVLVIGAEEKLAVMLSSGSKC